MRRFFWTIFLGLDVILLALFGAGYAARHIHPATLWWIQLIAIVLPFLAIAVVATTLVVFATARDRKKLMAAHAVALLLVLVRFGPAVLSGADEVVAAEDLTLLSFNLGYPHRQDGVRLAALARDVQPHVLALQEVYISLQDDAHAPLLLARYLRPLVDSLRYEVMVPAEADTSVLQEAVFSRGAVQELWYRRVPGGKDRSMQTNLVRSRLAWQGREAILYNLHLRSYGRRKPWDDERDNWVKPAYWRTYWRQYRDAIRERAREAEEIRLMLDAETLPIIVSGDFNSTPHSWEYHHIAARLNDAYVAAGEGWGGSYHRRRPLVRIDHLLVDDAFEVASARMVDAGMSDHRALVVRLRWR